MAKDELIAQALKAGAAKKSPVKGQKPKTGASAVMQGAVSAIPSKRANKPKEDKGFFETPVIKSILDTLSTGIYSAANWADFATAGKEKNSQILKEGMDAIARGDMLGGSLDILGSQVPGAGAVAGLAKGLSAGIGGNHSDANSMANTVVNLQTNAGIDPNSPESKLVQGIGGFAGDVLLDPLNVIPIAPVVKFAQGAKAGAKQFKAADSYAKKTGSTLPEYIAPTKAANAKKVGNEELAKYRKQKFDEQQAKDTAKILKKTNGTDEAKARFLVENVHVLRKGVYKAVAKTMDDPAVLAAKVFETNNTDEIMEALVKGDEVIPDEFVDPRDIEPNVAPHLGETKKLTTEQKLADELGKMRTVDKKPIYSAEVAANVAKLREVKAKPTKKDYATLGIQERHIPLMVAGTKVENVIDEISVGGIRQIARDIRNHSIPDKGLEEIAKLAGTEVSDRNGIAKFITEITTKVDETGVNRFKEAAKELGKYGTHRTGENPLPQLGVSGHGKLARPGMGYTPADIRAAMFASNPDDARKFLESNYQYHATELARHTRGAELRVIADDIFHKVIGDQRREAGPLRSQRGASVAEDLQSAKWETRWNTHSNLFRIAEVTKRINTLNMRKGVDYDDAWMKVLSDIDNRLRLAGIDSHLSNMKLYGDKLVVRLAPSDVFGLMKPADRIRYIHGNLRNTGSSLKEYLPSTILDMAEVLVRSATKLKADGTVDVDYMLNAALATLNGRFTKVNPGAREIGRNLDIYSYNKANYEVLQQIDRKLQTTYAKEYKGAKSQLDKIRILERVKNSDPADFKAFSIQRMHNVPKEIFNKFAKGMSTTGSESNILTALINTNMRNASVFGGSVAKEIGEASAEYTAKVLNALDTGTAGDFLSELVIRPPFSSADATARAILSENQKLVQRSVATESEIKAAEALNRNVNGTGNPAANNGAAFQRSDQITAEMAKNPKDINPEILFDLSQRELNKNMLFSIYGPGRFFDRRAGMRLSYEEVVGSAHASSLLMTGMHGIIRNWRARGISSEQLKQAMLTLKTPDAFKDDIAKELEQVMNSLFDPSKNNFLTRNSVGPDHFNRILKDVDFDDRFRVNPNATPEEMNNVWREWDITNVEDFISKLTGAMVKTAEDVSVGAAITSKFGKSVPEPGYIKLVDTKGKNPLFPLIDQNLYYPRELADEFVYIGKLMTEARGFKPGTGLYTFVTKVMDPVINLLKMTQTTMKPGHHIMSIIGDMWRNGLALSQMGINDPRKQLNLYFESARILRANVGAIKELEEFQKFQRLQGITTEIKIRNDGSGSEFFGNIGGGGSVNRTRIYELMQAKGVALPAHLGGMLEDFLTQFDELDSFGKKTGNRTIDAIGRVTSGVDRLVNPLHGKYSLNSFTAHRDTFTRAVIFLGAMRSKKFKNVDEASTYAAEQVKKWAPTALDLGAMEAKVARRIIFYYTWIRGMVPRIIESALISPGVVTIPNKLMYNVAIANGVDPMSIGDPFPEGKLMPSWYTERVIGPQYEVDGDLWGANPTGPLGDIMNSLGSNVKPKDFLTPDAFTKTAGTFLNMSTPWFKAPMEGLVLRRTLESGAPIVDPIQYFQDMIGPSRYLSKAIGKNLYLAPGPNGVVMPNRTEKKFARGMEGSIFEPGSETSLNALPELLNWASGLNFSNYTSDAAQNSAYYQRKDERKKERNWEQRLGG